MLIDDFSCELIHDHIGVGYVVPNVFDVDHVLWPVAFFLVRVCFEGSAHGIGSYSPHSFSTKTKRMIDLSDLMDWFAENSRSRVDNDEEHWVAIADE